MAVWLCMEGRRDLGDGAAETARFLRMALLGFRFAVAPAAPELDRELGDAVIEVEHDAVRAACTFSQATLIETLERDARRLQEIEELRDELARLAGDD